MKVMTCDKLGGFPVLLSCVSSNLPGASGAGCLSCVVFVVVSGGVEELR